MTAPGSHALTVDLEEWHHVCGVPRLDRMRDALPSRAVDDTRRLLDLLDRRNRRATFFVVGSVAERHPRLVEEVAAAGHEIGCHGYAHRPADELGPSGFEEDLLRATTVLQSITGRRPRSHRSAAWSLGRVRFDGLGAVVRAGYRRDASLVPTRLLGRTSHPAHPAVLETSAGPIAEWPPLTRRTPLGRVPLGFALGLRLTSNRIIERECDRLAREGRAAVLSIHPWELSPGAPPLRLPLGLHIAHFAGLAGLRAKLESLLEAMPCERLDRLEGVLLPQRADDRETASGRDPELRAEWAQAAGTGPAAADFG